MLSLLTVTQKFCRFLISQSGVPALLDLFFFQKIDLTDKVILYFLNLCVGSQLSCNT